MSAQSIAKTPSQPPQAASAQTPQAVPPSQVSGDSSAKSQTPPEPVIKLADVVRMAEKEGRSTSIGNYIAEDVGIKPTQMDSSPVQAHALSDTQRELCVIDDTGALLFMYKNGDNTVVYLANHAGALQLAGYLYPGRFRSQEFKSVSKEKAAAGFAAEKEFWIKKISPHKEGDEAKTAGAVKLDVKAAGKPAALKTAASTRVASDVDEKAKLSQMTPKERIKYLDQQMRDAKRAAKLEKKESEKEKKLASKTAQKPQEAKGDKSAEKSPQAAPANSNQQSSTDDATPAKKKISWF